MGNPSTSAHVHVFKPVSVCIYVTLGDDRRETEGSGSKCISFFPPPSFLQGGAKRERLWNGSQRRNQSGNKPHPFFSVKLCPVRTVELQRGSTCHYLSILNVEEPRNLIVSPPHFLRIYLMSHESIWTWPKNLCMEAREVCGNAVCIRWPQARKRFLPVQKMMHHSDPRNPSVDIIHMESKDISTKVKLRVKW